MLPEFEPRATPRYSLGDKLVHGETQLVDGARERRARSRDAFNNECWVCTRTKQQGHHLKMSRVKRSME